MNQDNHYGDYRASSPCSQVSTLRFRSERGFVHHRRGHRMPASLNEERSIKSATQARSWYSVRLLPRHFKSPNKCWSSAATVIAAVSARKVRPPSVTIRHPLSRAIVISWSVQPPSEPTSAVRERGLSGDSLKTSASGRPSRSENMIALPVLVSPSSDSNATGFSTTGTTARPDCLEASSAIRCQRETRFDASDESRKRMSASFRYDRHNSRCA